MKAQFDSFTFVIVHDGAQSSPLKNAFSPVSLKSDAGGSICQRSSKFCVLENMFFSMQARKNVEAFGQEGKSFNKSFQ